MKILRGIAMALMGLTSVFTILSGAGTSCVALAAEKYGPKMSLIAPYKWVYILFVVVTLAIGIMGVRATVLLAKGKSNGYRYSVIALVLGLIIGVIHMLVSRGLRGSSMPVDGVVYFTVLTLIVFLIFRIPALYEKIDFTKSTKKDNNRNAAAFTLVLSGIAVLTVPLWGAATHTFIPGGMNWANAWPVQTSITGILLTLAGVGLALAPLFKRIPVRDSSKVVDY